MAKVFSLLMTLVLMSSCAGGGGSGRKPKTAAQTQLQLRQFQTRDFDTTDTKMVMKAMLNVLQDDGFMTKSANLDLGLLSASKEVDVEKSGEKFWKTFWLGRNASWQKNAEIECTANISEFGKTTRVRVTFQKKVLTNKGEVAKVEFVDEEDFYRDFFTKVSKGLFIQGEGL